MATASCQRSRARAGGASFQRRKPPAKLRLLPPVLSAVLLMAVVLTVGLWPSSSGAWEDDATIDGAADASDSGTGRFTILMSSVGRRAGARRQAAALPGSTRRGPWARGRARVPGVAAALAAPRDAAAEAAAAPPSTRTVFVSFGNAAMFEFAHNWALGVQRLGAAYLLGALDAEMSALCARAGLPYVDLWGDAPGGGARATSANASFFRTDFAAFRNMGATKISLTLALLEGVAGVETVVVSDSDTSWLRSPQEYLDAHPAADWFISTDCLSPDTEAAWQPRHNQPRCGHIPGNTWGRAYNTGIFAVRNREPGRKLLRQWRDLVLGPNATVQTTTNQTFGLTDQMALNVLLEEGTEDALGTAPEDPRATLHRGGTLRLHPLPVLLFASGHVAFVQRAPWRHGLAPYVAHATFQRYGTSINRHAKKARFREFGMWFLDGPEYYAPPGARYLTYANGVRGVVSRLAAQRTLPALHKQVVAVSYQLALFRDALAAATMLNRTLVLPQSWCWCDYDWTPHVLERCKIRGTDLRLPFECPADYVFHIPLMEMGGLTGRYRLPGFLEDPRAAPELRLSRVELAVGDTPGALRLGSGQREIEAAAAPLRDAAVLHLSHMQPGLVRGFEAREASAAFDEMYANVTEQLYWCCAADGNFDQSVFWYPRPPPLLGEYQPWAPPELALPDWCDRSDLSAMTREAVAYANHPCSFLRNATAALVAADIS